MSWFQLLLMRDKTIFLKHYGHIKYVLDNETKMRYLVFCFVFCICILFNLFIKT